MVLRSIWMIAEEFSSFGGKVTCLHLYEFWPARHILPMKIKDGIVLKN